MSGDLVFGVPQRITESKAAGDGAWEVAGYAATYDRDTRSDLFLPEDGVRLTVNVTFASPALGGDYEYARLLVQLETDHRLPWGHGLRLLGAAGTVQGDAPFFDRFYAADWAYFTIGPALGRALELPVVRLLAERREVPETTKRALAALQALPDDAAWRHVVRADLDYHRGLVEAAGNRRLAKAHGDLLSEIALCIAQTGTTYEQASEVAREHERLAKAIRSGTVRTLPRPSAKVPVSTCSTTVTGWLR